MQLRSDLLILELIIPELKKNRFVLNIGCTLEKLLKCRHIALTNGPLYVSRVRRLYYPNKTNKIVGLSLKIVFILLLFDFILNA